jgi:hypothetical protein
MTTCAGRCLAAYWVSAAWLPVVLLGGAVSAATSGEAARRIHFAQGRSSAIIEDAVIRGERNRYVLGARAGQRMVVRISALEKNSAFAITRPDGKPLRGAEEERDVTSWSGKLPVSGDYTITVGGTRGNATYRLRVTITGSGAPAGRRTRPSSQARQRG